MNTGTRVTLHEYRHIPPEDRTDGTIVASGAAWTPNDLTDTAPDSDMVRVRWDGEGILSWEYVEDLTAV